MMDQSLADIMSHEELANHCLINSDDFVVRKLAEGTLCPEDQEYYEGMSEEFEEVVKTFNLLHKSKVKALSQVKKCSDLDDVISELQILLEKLEDDEAEFTH